MKKHLGCLAALALCLCLLTVAALAADSAQVYVAIAANGGIDLAWEPVYATDRDTDGIISISDALYCAHEQAYPGGASAGYNAEKTQYGISLTRLWGVENGGAYGYYINGDMAMSLADPVAEGDVVYAFACQDLTGWSDVFSYFDYAMVYTTVDQQLDLTLFTTGFDADWNLTRTPCCGAEVYVQVSDTSPVFLDAGGTTDENGAFSITFLRTGRFVITAKADDRLLTPPVCVVYVDEKVLTPAEYALQILQELYAQGMTDASPITRQLLVEALYQSSGAPEVEGSSLFSDVDESNAAVTWASRCGLIQGYGDGTFGGEDVLTRQQLAVIADRYLSAALGVDLSALGQTDLSAYADSADVADWARDAVSHMAALGFITGDSLRPQDPFTLGDAAELIALAMTFAG